MDHLNTAQKKLLQDIREDKEAREELSTLDEVLETQQQQTHNGIF
jgi:hypothetical protein